MQTSFSRNSSLHCVVPQIERKRRKRRKHMFDVGSYIGSYFNATQTKRHSRRCDDSHPHWNQYSNSVCTGNWSADSTKPNRQSVILYWRWWHSCPRFTVAVSLKQALNAGDCLSPRISRTDSSFGSYTVRSLSPLSVLPNTQNETLNYEGPLRLPGLSESHTIHRAGFASGCSHHAPRE